MSLNFADRVNLISLLNTVDSNKYPLQQFAVAEIDYEVDGQKRTAKNVITQFDNVTTEGANGSVNVPGIYKLRVHFVDEDNGCDIHQFHGELNLNLFSMSLHVFTSRELRCKLHPTGYRLKLMCQKNQLSN